MEETPCVRAPLRLRVWDAIKRHERATLTVAAGLQLAVLFAMIAVHSVPLWCGETILLRVQPVDPRDFLRGDYVILSYEMNRMRVEGLPQDARYYGGQHDWPVYVTLEPEADGAHWHAVHASMNPPSSGRYITGRYTGGRLQFGIETYYVEEGTGRTYEQAIRTRRLSAEVALTSWGQAALRGLKIE